VKEVTKIAFKALKKASKDSSSGLSGGSFFRNLWEPEEGNNNFKELVDMFDRSELEQEYTATVVRESFKFFDLMKLQMQNDAVAPIHRDMAYRYSSRISRVLNEVGRRESMAKDKTGIISQLEDAITGFLAARGGER